MTFERAIHLRKELWEAIQNRYFIRPENLDDFLSELEKRGLEVRLKPKSRTSDSFAADEERWLNSTAPGA